MVILDLPKDEYGNYQMKKVTKTLIINICILKKYVPVQTAAMQKLVRQFDKLGHLRYPDWVQGNRAGRKAAISESTFDSVVDEFSLALQGGKAMSKGALSKKLENLIREEWKKQHGTEYPYEYIPESTLRKYINDVHTLHAFNYHTSVLNKTESRFASEFSIRSTISFMLVVLSTHYINAEPSIYHKPVSELEKDPIYLLIKKIKQRNVGVDRYIGIKILSYPCPPFPHSKY